MSSTAAGPASNLDTVLANLGRAAAPPVRTNPFSLTRAGLLGVAEEQSGARVVVVGPRFLLKAVSAAAPAVPGVPGVLPEQVDLPSVDTLVIDWRAFAEGPWLGADTHAAHSLTEELFEAGRRMRATGRMVLAIPRRPLTASGDARLLSTCTLDLTGIPAADLEEGAPHPPLWDVLLEAAGVSSPARTDHPGK